MRYGIEHGKKSALLMIAKKAGNLRSTPYSGLSEISRITSLCTEDGGRSTRYLNGGNGEVRVHQGRNWASHRSFASIYGLNVMVRCMAKFQSRAGAFPTRLRVGELDDIFHVVSRRFLNPGFLLSPESQGESPTMWYLCNIDIYSTFFVFVNFSFVFFHLHPISLPKQIPLTVSSWSAARSCRDAVAAVSAPCEYRP